MFFKIPLDEKSFTFKKNQTDAGIKWKRSEYESKPFDIDTASFCLMCCFLEIPDNNSTSSVDDIKKQYFLLSIKVMSEVRFADALTVSGNMGFLMQDGRSVASTPLQNICFRKKYSEYSTPSLFTMGEANKFCRTTEESKEHYLIAAADIQVKHFIP